jgi:serine/threonine protein kinase
MFQIGDHIGPYSLLQKIGRGAFGEVWLAEEKTAISSHRVALKLPNEEDVDLEAIRQEATVWEEVKGHPNILPIIKADIVDDQIYIASEYAPDGSLSKWIKFQGGKAPSTEIATQMIRGILSGLEHLHSKGIVHRDLKPENILLQAETPRIADFGIARLIKATSNSTKATGTPSYMAPECFFGTRSEETDLWATGVIFHLLLTGKLPFPQSDQVSVMNAILNGSAEVDSSIPPNFQYIIRRSLQKNPVDRYRSALDVLNDLNSDPSDSRFVVPRFSSISIPTTSEEDVETETVVINKITASETIPQKLRNLNIWKVSFVALGMLILVFGGAWAGIKLMTGKTLQPQTQQSVDNPSLGNSVESVSPVLNPGLNAESTDSQPQTPQGATPSETLPTSRDYNNSYYEEPTQYSPQQYYPPRGQAVTVDPNGGSQFMPQDNGVILVPVPVQPDANTAPTTKPPQYTPAANEAVKPTPKPMATPPPKAPKTTGKPAETKKSGTDGAPDEVQ